MCGIVSIEELGGIFYSSSKARYLLVLAQVDGRGLANHAYLVGRMKTSEVLHTFER